MNTLVRVYMVCTYHYTFIHLKLLIDIIFNTILFLSESTTKLESLPVDNRCSHIAFYIKIESFNTYYIISKNKQSFTC